ncbi:von Willebrand factor A domain-containing protein 1-like [Myxocyprinus asiaticus]|uniref:von Willebrand factor A domain-containing protein 1-like n=1 Tax=Myxocyprinus asiaticus TaxID=70543 RepID=UPI002223301B|nr:von Willebrand factor A domain-containing protein 1-like [Myxocyprinus asiaticus]XP_051517839.1 von Willebrand factor A domain-containing protein 1-like [Myxocyprinus asiaticus]
MEVRKALTCVFFSVFLWSGDAQDSVPDSVLNCCEGDVLFLLDSSGSVASYEFFRMVNFLSELLLPFSLGLEQVRVGLLQVGTEPHLEFGFDTYNSQQGLQAALKRTRQLKGDTNTVDALLMAWDQVLKQGVPGGARPDLPRVLVWLTDGVDPGAVQEPMARLREEGVAVLVVSTGHGNYQVLRDVVSPPAEEHLFFVDIDDISIITEDLRNAIIEIIRAERLQVKSVTTTTALLEWRPVLAGTGYYDIQFGPVRTGGNGGPGGSGTSPGTGLEPFKRITRPGDASSAHLIGLRPDTTYTVTLTPKANLDFLNSLSATFTTQPVSPPQPEVQTLSTVTVSESTTNSVRVSWGPLQPNLIQGYQIEYSALHTGQLRVINVSNRQNSTVLTNLYPDTQYLVTVSAKHFSGKERAMSVKACTQEVLPALSDLQLTAVGNESVQLRWKGSADGLRGYWVTWERGRSQRSTLYLPPNLLSTTLTHVPPSARVCVSPVYRTARGEGLCCTA